MKKLLLMFGLFLLISSCEEIGFCNCDYVVYSKKPSTNFQWKETYRSTWDATCRSETLSESQYTTSSGVIWYSRTKIECK
ncbi:MAG: hypothetical protein IIC75_03315 [Bacteroidetes bacterium]|nr:hypothetical protein [Bacteroidota bacterium]